MAGGTGGGGEGVGVIGGESSGATEDPPPQAQHMVVDMKSGSSYTPHHSCPQYSQQ